MNYTAQPEVSEEEVIRRLWYLANAAYNVDHPSFSQEAEVPAGAPPWPSAQRFVDFDQLAGNIFTPAGTAQLLSAQIGGGPYVYQEGGVTYHLGSWKTGRFYEDGYQSHKVAKREEDRLVLEITYSIRDLDGKAVETAAAPMTLCRVEGRWLVEDFRYPEAVYPEA